VGGPGTGGQPGRLGGGPVGEEAGGRGARSGGLARGAGAAGAGGFLPPGGAGDGDEDKEHINKFGPVDWHDEFWDDTEPVAPAVIGLDEDET
jgi:hypothetical protein